MIEVDHFCSGLEIGIVMHDGESVLGCEHLRQQIGHADGSMPALPGQ